MDARIHIDNVSLKFRKYQGQSFGIKDAVMRTLSPPSWSRNIRSTKEEIWGLRDVSLNIKKGDRLGVIGHNGAGKSTLLKLISRIYKPTHGNVDVHGRIAPLIEIGAGFSIELSGRENVFLNGAILGIPKKALEERLDAIIEFSELKEFVDVPVKYYSTGMYLRLAFTIATEVAPEILILDELYAGADLGFIDKANQRLDNFVKESQILILVAHNMDYVRRFCNRAIVLDHGVIRAQGDVDDVVRRYTDYCSGDTEAYDRA